MQRIHNFLVLFIYRMATVTLNRVATVEGAEVISRPLPNKITSLSALFEQELNLTESGLIRSYRGRSSCLAINKGGMNVVLAIGGIGEEIRSRKKSLNIDESQSSNST